MNHIIYIPGLGDHFDPFRRLVLHTWKRRDVRVTFVPMRWRNKHETYEQKYQRVNDAMRRAGDSTIILVGESAGAAMVLLAFSRHSDHVSEVITICGYNHGAADVHQTHKRNHPAFYQLMPAVDEVVANLGDTVKKITTIYSTLDLVVTPQHSRIDGAKTMIMRTPGHFATIVRVITRRYPVKISQRDRD